MVAFDILFDIRHVAAWGFYVVMYIFLTGLSAGSFVLSSLYRVFGVERFRSSERIAAVLAVILLVAAPVFLLLDLSQPTRFYNTLYLVQPTSVMSWGVYLLIIYPIVVLIYTWYLLRADMVRRMRERGDRIVSYFLHYVFVLGQTKLNEASLDRDRRRARAFATIGIPLALAVHGYTGLILAVVVGRPIWHTFLLPILFLVSAIISGLALLILVCAAHARLSRSGGPMGPEGLKAIGRFMGGMILLDLALIGIELAMLNAEGQAGQDAAWLLTRGPLWQSFLYGGIFIGSIAPLILVFMPSKLFKNKRAPGVLAWGASFLVLVGVLGMRLSVIIGGQLIPPTGGDALVEGKVTLEQMVNTLMILSVAYCGLFAVAKLLPLVPKKSKARDRARKGPRKGLAAKIEPPNKEEVGAGQERKGEAVTGAAPLRTELTRREFVKVFGLTAGVSLVHLHAIVEGPGLLKQIFPEPDTIGSGREWGMVIDLRRCIGCNSCTQACKERFDLPAGTYRAWVVKYRKPDGGVGHLPRLCNHCENPPCVPVCPVGATFKHGDGFVLQRPDRCIGCKYCMVACPYEARFINPRTGVTDKCTLCNELVERGQEPACVKACPTGARIFGDLGDPASAPSAALRREKGEGLREDLGTGPRVHYIGVEEAVATGEFRR